MLEGPMLETLDYTIRIGSTPTFLYFDLSSLLCLRSTLRLFQFCHIYMYTFHAYVFLKFCF